MVWYGRLSPCHADFGSQFHHCPRIFLIRDPKDLYPAMATHEVTDLLSALEKGDERVVDRLFELVYGELRQIAHRQLKGERADHTLNTTAVVHEAYLKLVKSPPKVDWAGRKHFLAVAGRAMRQVLVNYANARNAEKRGGLLARMTFDEDRFEQALETDEMVALNEALERLARFDLRQVQIVECRYFAGLTIDETADVLDISVATVSRDWATARLWLNREIRGILNPSVNPGGPAAD